MIYASISDLSIIVGAADTMAEFEHFYNDIVHQEIYNFVFTQPNVMEMLSEEHYRGLKLPPYVLTFENEADMKTFAKQFSVCPLNFIADKQNNMTKHTKAVKEKDTRTISEIYGLDKFDPWDKRSDEQKKKDEDYKEKAKKSKEEGNLTGESFSGPEKELQVRRVTLGEDKDGEVFVDNVLAVKGLFDKDEEAKKETKTFFIKDFSEFTECMGLFDFGLSRDAFKNYQTNEIAAHRIAVYMKMNNEQFAFTCNQEEIGPDEDIAQRLINAKDKIYFKLVVKNKSFREVFTILSATDKQKIVDCGQVTDYCWFVFKSKTHAVIAQKSINADAEIYPTDATGLRLVPEGIELYEKKDFVEPPRAWNEKVTEIAAMSAEQLEENTKSLSGEEFYFSGSYIDAQTGCIVYITPKSYFKKNNKRWRKALDIINILPSDLKEIAPGVYQTRSRDWMNLYHDLSKRKFEESMSFQLYMNSEL